MTIGRIVGIIALAILVGVIAGLLTRSLIVAIGFPILLLVFYFMGKSLKGINGMREKQDQEEKPSTENIPRSPDIE